MKRHTLALIITFFLSFGFLFLIALIFVWIGWASLLTAFLVSLAFALFGLFQALLVERKKARKNEDGARMQSAGDEAVSDSESDVRDKE